jgi:hypothetical protein
MTRAILENNFPRLASVIALALLIFDHLLCPDMFFLCYSGLDPESIFQKINWIPAGIYPVVTYGAGMTDMAGVVGDNSD